MRIRKSILLIPIFISGCTSVPLKASMKNETDSNIWLESSKDPKVVKWVQDHNAQTTQVLESDPRFQSIATQARAIVTAKDRIPYPNLHGKMVRNFWQDQTHLRGYLRQTTLNEYLTQNPTWETILDIDELNHKEGKSWVYSGMACLAPDSDICLIKLSDGGKDEVIVREFQVSTKSFVRGGFEVPAAKTSVGWIDRDTIFLQTDFGPGSMTTSGYPRQVRIWKRGTPMADAKLVFEGNATDVSVSGWKIFRHDSNTMYISQGLNFFEDKIFVFDGTKTTELPFPTTSNFQGEFAGQIMTMLRNDWTVGSKTYVAGTVVSLPLSAVGQPNPESKLETIFVPDSNSTFDGFSRSKNYLLLSVLNNVRGELRHVTRHAGAWVTKPVKLPNEGTLTIVDASDDANDVFVAYQTYNVPTALYYGNGDFKHPLKAIKSLPAKFNASDIVIDQFHSTSKDGTKIPYFVVHKKGFSLDGTNPTVLYGYGGFEVSLTPMYQSVMGKVWLERGGVYVVANIRGGGEFGPKWHAAALKENRQRAYDDFESVARDLIARKITTPRRLGIQGGSNGGLLVGVAVTQHPELYNAVVCESALLDMIRYTQMPPGASWIGEYGDPAVPSEAAYIEKYSPYQNIAEAKTGAVYPEILFHTSTADDRVQPGHSRKMTERFEQKGHRVMLYENTEGGHGGAADPEQTVHKVAIEYTYLFRKLVD